MLVMFLENDNQQDNYAKLIRFYCIIQLFIQPLLKIIHPFSANNDLKVNAGL